MGGLRLWIKRKLCRHSKRPRYEEVLSKDEWSSRWSWYAFYECPECGEMISVEASFYGDPDRVSEAIEEALS